MTPRVIVFISGMSHPMAAHAIAAAGSFLVGIVANDGAGLVDYTFPEHLTADAVMDFGATHGISAGYRSIIPADVIAAFTHGIVNVHTGYLPHGRGAHPNAYAIALQEPAGVTLHLIDKGVDTGPIIHQSRVDVRPTDTAKDLHERLTEVACGMIRQHVPLWMQSPDLYPLREQPWIWYPARKKADLDQRLVLDARVVGSVRSVIDTLRSRTFPPHAGCPYLVNGKWYRVRIEITEDA